MGKGEEHAIKLVIRTQINTIPQTLGALKLDYLKDEKEMALCFLIQQFTHYQN